MIGLKSEVIGTWEFTLTRDPFTVDLSEVEAVCSHLLPNRIQIVLPGTKFYLGNEL
jgi:hypothetical protein